MTRLDDVQAAYDALGEPPPLAGWRPLYAAVPGLLAIARAARCALDLCDGDGKECDGPSLFEALADFEAGQ